MPIRFLFLALTLFTSLAFADAPVLEVDVAGGRVAIKRTYETQGWKANEAVCLSRGTQRVGCGRALMATGDRLWINMGTNARMLYKGSLVTISRPERGISSINANAATTTRRSDSHNNFDVGLGGQMSFSYFNPELHFNVRLNERFSMGVEGILSRFKNGATEVGMWGTYLNFSYYHTNAAFRGWVFQFGPGFYELGLKYRTLELNTSMFALRSQAYWRGTAKAAFNMDFGFGLGFQYVFGKDVPGIDYAFRGFLPFVNFFVGYQF